MLTLANCNKGINLNLCCSNKKSDKINSNITSVVQCNKRVL